MEDINNVNVNPLSTSVMQRLSIIIRKTHSFVRDSEFIAFHCKADEYLIQFRDQEDCCAIFPAKSLLVCEWQWSIFSNNIMMIYSNEMITLVGPSSPDPSSLDLSLHYQGSRESG